MFLNIAFDEHWSCSAFCHFYDVAFPDWNDEQWQAYVAITYRKTAQGDYDLNFDRNIGHAARAGVSGLDIDPWTLFDSIPDVPALPRRVRGPR